MALPDLPSFLATRALGTDEIGKQPAEALLRIYGWMQLSRSADNRILELFRQGLIKGTVTGGQGNEALCVPLALLADKSLDVVSFTHRDLGGHLGCVFLVIRFSFGNHFAVNYGTHSEQPPSVLNFLFQGFKFKHLAVFIGPSV